MSGVAFVGEGGEEREVVGEVPVVDVDYIFRSVVDGFDSPPRGKFPRRNRSAGSWDRSSTV